MFSLLISFNPAGTASILFYNGLALGAVADFGAQNCQHSTKVDAR
jgi:hypothetical protein